MVWNCSIVAVTLLFGVSGKSKAFRNAGKTELSCKIIDADDEWIKICYTEKKDKFAFLPQPMAAPSLLKKEIVQIPLKDEIPERQICLVYDSQHPMGAAARELKNTILLIT